MNYLNSIAIFGLLVALFFMGGTALHIFKVIKNADDKEERFIASILSILIFALGGCVTMLLLERIAAFGGMQ